MQNLLGFRIVFMSNVIAGLWIPVSILQVEKYNLFLNFLIIYDLLLIICYLMQITSSLFLVASVNFKEDLNLFVIFSVNIMTFMATLFRACYLTINKNHLKSIFKEIEYIFNSSTFIQYRMAIIKRLSKQLVYFFLIPAVSYFSVYFLTTVYFYDLVDKASRSQLTNSTDSDAKLVKRLAEFSTSIDAKWFLLQWIISTTIQMMGYLKNISTDSLIIGIFLFIHGYLNYLKKSLLNAVYPPRKFVSSSHLDISQWLNSQRMIAK